MDIGNDSRNLVPDDDDEHVQLSHVPAIIVATTSCCDDSYDRASMLFHHASLLQEERRIILHIHALRGDSMEEPRWEGTKTLYPGSLRERGEYCLVHLEVVSEDGEISAGKSSSTPSLFRWQVSRVDFRRMGDMESATIQLP